MMFQGREQEACPRAVDCVCKKIGMLLINEKGKLGFLLKDDLYVVLCSFKVDFQGGQLHWTQAGSM